MTSEEEQIRQQVEKAVEEAISHSTNRFVSREDLRDTVRLTVQETFVRMGVDGSDPLSLQKDFMYLREWRETADAVRRRGFMTLAAVAVSGLLGAVWIGVKSMMGK